MKTKKLNFTQPKKSRYVLFQAKLLLAIFTISFLTLTSCKSDDNDKDEEKQPDGVALKESVIQNRKDAIQEFNEDFCSGCTVFVTGEQGTKITFPPNSLGLNGTPITGSVQIELIEIYGKSDMVLQDMSTKGKKSNGDEEALNSAGEFFVNAKQNGNQLEILTPINISSKDITPAEWEPMNIFKAGDNLEDEDLWKEVDENGDQEPDQAEGREGEGSNGDYVMYSSFDVSGFGWNNLDKWYNFTGPKTTLFVDVPDGYNETNSNVYLSYDDESGLAKMDIWSTTQQMFTEHYGSIPIGKEVHFIMITDISDQLYYKIQAATIVDNHIEVMSDLQPISEADLTTAINALP